MRIPSSGCRSRVHSFLFLICTCWASAGYAADWNSAAQELARKIAPVVGPGNVSLRLANLSSLSPKEVQEVDRDLRLQLASSGVHTVGAEQGVTTVDVTLSENARGYLWVAVLHRPQTESAIVMVPVARPDTTVPVQDLPPMSLRKTLLWTQDRPMLDVLLLEGTNPVRMMVLDPEDVEIYRVTNGRWLKEQSLALAHSMPWPRDLRGKLVPRPDHGVDAYLPGGICQISGSLNSVACRNSADPWPLSPQIGAFFASSRNFFTGALTPGIGRFTSISKFYSAASLPRQNSTLWVIAVVDGTVHVLDGNSDQSLSVRWGSDIASVRSSCGSGSQLLATQPGVTSSDAIRVFDMPERDPVPVSVASDFAGPITALWTEAAGASAIAVSKNAATGSYEAYRVAVACGQ
jgi:hypothetical protein